MADATMKDFGKGDVVQHLFHGIHGTVKIVGRKYLTVEVGGAHTLKWLPTSVRKVGHADVCECTEASHWRERSDGSEYRVGCDCTVPGCSCKEF